MTHAQLAGFPVVIEVDASWGAMDSFRHLNNVVYFRHFEDARVEYLRRVGWFDLMDATGVGPIVASTHARFRRAVKWPDRLLIGARVITLDTDRVTFEHRIVSTAMDDLATEGQAVVVCYDYRQGKKTALPFELRERIDRLEQVASGK
jgi:acyl-CoA thioester hydrolase